MVMTTTDLVTAVENRFSTPADQDRFATSDILLLADEETQLKLLPLILGVRENYLLRTLTTSISATATSYAVPPRSIRRGLRAITYVRDEVEYPLNEIGPETAWRFTNSGAQEPTAYYFLGDRIVPVPTASDTNGSLKLFYECKPSQLTATSNAAQITAIDTTTGVLTCATTGVPTSVITTSTPVDLVQNVAGNELLAMELTPSNVSATTVTVAAASLPASLAVGDWIALAGKTPVVQLPEEMHAALALLTAMRMLQGMGDLEMLAVSQKEWQDVHRALLALYTPRNSTAAKVILNRNGFLRRPPVSGRFYRGL